VLNMLPSVAAMLEDKRSPAAKAYCFHLTLAHGLLAMAVTCGAGAAARKVALSGGVMQNLLLLKLSCALLKKNGFQPLHHVRVPANDGGISLGQAALAAMKSRKEL